MSLKANKGKPKITVKYAKPSRDEPSAREIRDVLQKDAVMALAHPNFSFPKAFEGNTIAKIVERYVGD